ncbi:MAG: DivIVA protein, partial [Solirubrobacterales bacterium]|nr:DivIVA protein [Solirubrobacterales bacterium]
AAPRAARAPEPAPAAATPEPAPPSATSGDLDGARLIALNMALNGESRADTERYLAQNFQLEDQTKLVDEVYTAIEG